MPGWSGKFPDDPKGVRIIKKSCITTFYAHLSRTWKLTRFTRFIRKVFATKNLAIQTVFAFCDSGDNLWYRPKKGGLGYILPGCYTVQNSKPGIAEIGWPDLQPTPSFLAISGFWQRLFKPSIPNSSLVDWTAMTLAIRRMITHCIVYWQAPVMAKEYRDSEVEFWSKLG